VTCGSPVSELTNWIHARARQALARAPRHALHHKAETRIARRALRLPQSRALVPSQARAMLFSTSASCTAGSCGNASSISSS
jgi:hypothetical protein